MAFYRLLYFCTCWRFYFPRGLGVWVGVACFLLLHTATPVALGREPLERTSISPETLLADQLVLLARRSLATEAESQLDQLVMARILMDFALELKPDDAELWLLGVELAQKTGNRDREMEVLSKYCKLKPEDDTAQLSLIMRSVGSRQTIDERLALVERVLDGSGAEQLSAPLRSRLSSFVATGALELGDTSKFLRRLKDAVTLDRSNKEAARLTVNWLRSKEAPPGKIGEALMHLVYADPMDPYKRRELGQLLLSQGAYTAAGQQFQVAQRLTDKPWDDRFYYNYVFCQAADGYVEEAIEWLARDEAARVVQAQIQKDQESDEDQGQAKEGGSPQAIEIGLPMDHELLRLAILHQTGQRARASGSYNRLKYLLMKRVEAGDAPARADLLWLGLLFNQEIPDPGALKEVLSGYPEDDPFTARLMGWVHFRQGNIEEARRAWVKYFDQDPFAAYGVAQTYRKLDDPQRLRQLQLVVRMAPGNLAGMMAALDLVEAGSKPRPTNTGVKLTNLLSQWPTQLALLDPNEGAWTSMSIHVEPSSYRYLEPISARLTLRNMTDYPLSLGPDHTVPSRVMIYVVMRRAGIVAGKLPPMVVDLHRRLQLPPRGLVSVNTRLDRGELGGFLVNNPTENISFDIQSVLGPRVGPDGPVNNELGLLGEMDSAYLIERQGWLLTMENIDQQLSMINSVDPIGKMLGLAAAMQIAINLEDSEESEISLPKITTVVNEAYDRLSPVGQAWMARFLPPGQKGQELFAAVHGGAQRSTHRMVRILYATTQVKKPDSPVLNTMLRDSDPIIAEYARALRSGLKAERPTDEQTEE